ncbi:bifunctional folylpolyglutamate synthase/dihydrofolate synthase [Alkalihalobacillus deserti]|uniref:bifunctional folylpolyglutamate synthase/dihydrofolate synthase n=1 Tax=Alkalihalobacillus deserti TaxID=2879466 RepID=UPI001D139917|nr:Mur ligase family protein [Alkalihalobacillus deserti]
MSINTVKDAEDLIYYSYIKAINHITEVRDEKVKKPELTRRLLDLIASPDKGQKFILVTGSKGKGSTSRFISSLLSHLGFRVGLFTSPHLVDFNERIRIDGKAISDQDLIRISNQIKGAVETIEQSLADNEYQGPIGIALAIASIYFQENKTDINVIECGRGGKYDDTNVLDNEWAVITPIMEEHVTHLGPHLSNIVTHKLGIIKDQTKSVFINKQSELVSTLLKDRLPNNKVYKSYKNDFLIEHIEMTTKGTHFTVQTKRMTYAQLSVPLLGEFQALNAGMAVSIAEDIVNGPINEHLLRECFTHIQWPGRCEVIQLSPTVILDGAINELTANYVKEVVKIIDSKRAKRTVTIIGVPANKDYEGVIKVLSEVSDLMIVTKPDISHLPFPKDDLETALIYNSNSVSFPVLHGALNYVRKEEDAELIVIIGTQTFIGNAKRLFGHSLLDIGK